MGALARLLFAIPPAEVSVARRGFRVDRPELRERLESIGATFVAGYHQALEAAGIAALARRLDAVDLERRGFAYEGAAMALAVTDALARWRRPRWRDLLDGPGAPHAYLVHVGAGWARARLGRAGGRALAAADPLLVWLAWDGAGFHEGFFRPRRAGAPEPARTIAGYARRAFDQGLGRSLWFREGADPERIAAAIASCPAGRRDDLWSGAGLAAAYAGGAGEEALAELRRRAGAHAPWLAQGAAFAAEARRRAGNPAAHTRAACRALAGLDDQAAALLTLEALEELPAEESPRGAAAPGCTGGTTRREAGAARYEAWRRGVRDRLAAARRPDDGAAAARGHTSAPEGATLGGDPPPAPRPDGAARGHTGAPDGATLGGDTLAARRPDGAAHGHTGAPDRATLTGDRACPAA